MPTLRVGSHTYDFNGTSTGKTHPVLTQDYFGRLPECSSLSCLNTRVSRTANGLRPRDTYSWMVRDSISSDISCVGVWSGGSRADPCRPPQARRPVTQAGRRPPFLKPSLSYDEIMEKVRRADDEAKTVISAADARLTSSEAQAKRVIEATYGRTQAHVTRKTSLMPQPGPNVEVEPKGYCLEGVR